MSSTIFYRFKSQNKNSKIAFDGTGLTVFDLKKEIININKMAPATDFNLSLSNPDTDEEYKDDNQVIPRSSFVIARRYPSSRVGKGNASRYIAGKPRVSKTGRGNLAWDNHNKNSTSASGGIPGSTSAAGNMITISEDKNISEEDKIKAMFQNQDMAWQETQEMMENATPVYVKRGDNAASKNEPPPPGYICYRCGSKDHFIKNCPTNGDVSFDGKRIKRTAGIPKSSLKVVDKPPTDNAGGFMLTEDGQFVVAMADKKAWETYQKKQNLFNNLNTESITDKSLIDPITKKLFQKPVKTPCCGKTYSLDTLEGLLIESDFICPNCDKSDIFLDQLVEDKEMNDKIKTYLENEAEKNGLKRSDIDSADPTGNAGLPDLKRIKVDDGIDLPSRPQLPAIPNVHMPMVAPPGFPMMPVNGLPFMPMPSPNGFPFNGMNNGNNQ
ncbi:cleavage polyadenylation factor subunit [Saccharomycopsis crataegensis]|uniref:Cleavage polyadenylation factor subunit n=1 Tax=Saccharomycopsis crataegensis TaxID=43959 RepID=A0AAV5QII7_9ASCO|nr:cleavage polyadenylation factor subunit [Saccharomycopsis crataegensis]